MIAQVPHNFLVKEVTAPASKSFAQRAILAAALAEGKSEIFNPGKSEDVTNIIKIAEQLGAELSLEDEKLSIRGRMKSPGDDLNCGESGLGVRLTTPIAAALGGTYAINGTGSLLNRPMGQFEKILPHLGVEVTTTEGKLPMQIRGILQGGNFEIEANLSSQFLSGLLMALPLASEDSWIKVTDLNSRPYIDMTIDVLARFGVDIAVQEDVYFIRGGQNYKPDDYIVEGDWSGAAFWAVYGAISRHEIIIKDLVMWSSQADAAILEVLEICGVQFEWLEEDLKISPSTIQPFTIDLTQCPDLFPPVVVLAAAANGKSEILGLSRLKHKESDRGLALQTEFEKLGLKIDLEEDKMVIYGESKLNAATIHSHNDHRIAMAGAISAVLTSGTIEIEGAEAVAKSYPTFWDEISHP